MISELFFCKAAHFVLKNKYQQFQVSKENKMLTNQERRIETRLRYNWPIWFAEDFADELTQGQMIDISSSGAAFSCFADRCPYPGDKITARFSVPKYNGPHSFDMTNFVRHGKICRVDEISPYIRRVALQFAEPLPFKPAESEKFDNEMAPNGELLSV
jgi:hypothetical protein